MGNKKPKLLDLFCGAGGASMGYYHAGFEVEGVDIKPQPHYPFKFYQADALEFSLEGYDAYHASPPCQYYIAIKRKRNPNGHPDFIDLIRDRLVAENKPFVIENVPDAVTWLENPIKLCGTMFGLPIWKHRYFEVHPTFYSLLNTCNHKLGKLDTELGKIDIPVYCSHSGDSPKNRRPSRQGWRWRPRATKDIQLFAMGIDWANLPRRSIHEAIPPAYTEYIGKYLIKVLKEVNQ